MCKVLPKRFSFETGSLTLNVFTSYAFVEKAKENECECVIQTAAFSQNGKIMIRACKSEGIKTINIVRNEDQIPILKELGGDLVLNSLDSEFWEKLSCGIKEYNATILFDYIGGDLPGKILKAMPESSQMYACGIFAKSQYGDIDVLDLITNGKEVEGFNIDSWAASQNKVKMGGFAKKILEGLDGVYQVEVKKVIGMDKVEEGWREYMNEMNKGKIVIKPWEDL